MKRRSFLKGLATIFGLSLIPVESIEVEDTKLIKDVKPQNVYYLEGDYIAKGLTQLETAYREHKLGKKDGWLL